MYKDRNDKLKMGPIWDFDWHSVYTIVEGFVIKDAIWYDRLFQDPNFIKEVKKIWNNYKFSIVNQVNNHLNLITPKLLKSAKMNELVWGAEFGNFETKTNEMKLYIEKRVKWLDTAINDL